MSSLWLGVAKPLQVLTGYGLGGGQRELAFAFQFDCVTTLH